jgi:hypothetical protein
MSASDTNVTVSTYARQCICIQTYSRLGLVLSELISKGSFLVPTPYYVHCFYRHNDVTLPAGKLHITLMQFETLDEAVVGKCSKSDVE